MNSPRAVKFFSKAAAVFWLIIHSVIIIIFLNVTWNLTSDLWNLNKPYKIPPDIMAEYNYLKSTLGRPDKKLKTTTDGLKGFQTSEWPVMTYSLFAYGARNLAIRDPTLKREVGISIGKVIQRLKNPEYYYFIVKHYGDPFKSEAIKQNVFYLGHFTLVLALYREVTGDATYDVLFHKFARVFYDNFKKSPYSLLDSYPGLCWTSEQAVPLKALKIHDQIFKTNYFAEVLR